jgi:tetratricopeptide (TPR) repeat protein
MNRDVSPTSDPDPERPDLESLEQKLRALPLPAVPDGLRPKLIASIPSIKSAGSPGGRVLKLRPWVGMVGAICLAFSAAAGSLFMYLNREPDARLNEGPKPTASSTTSDDAVKSSKAVRDYEEAVRFDPYNADAWFGLAKAQADLNRSADAISSAEKAIDIGRSRNRTDFVSAVKGWLQSYRASRSRRAPR